MKKKTYPTTRYAPLGDSALLVEFGDTISLEANHKVTALDVAVQDAEILGVKELVPTYRSLLVRYDPSKVSYEQLAFCIKDLEQTPQPDKEADRRIIDVPVVYGGQYGPDLGCVAQRHGLSKEQVSKLHSEREYRVYMIGFVAGFPYLGEVADKIATPRLETPRLKVPAGSVGIAERQTGIYPCEAPGGWQIIGRTPLKLFDIHWKPPALLKPGDKVRFKPIDETEFQRMCKE
jgi:KipI family sensor histidine kinase inhibitor